MNTSTRSPRRGNDAPFQMHLERVCRLIELGASFTIEFNPCSDIPSLFGEVLQGVRLRIHEDGDVSVHMKGSAIGMKLLGLNLANYKKLWRCWQNGAPSVAQRRATRWG